MCTLTWFVKDDGYELFFNRDELKTRSRAEPPTIHNQSSVSYISPTDTDAGGTWIASNHFGITLCLLNYYQFEQVVTSKNWISRGEFVRDFATTSNLECADQEFKDLDLNQYRAFRLFMIDPKGHNRLFVWDGNQLHIEKDITGPKTSSSVNTKAVKASRYGLYGELQLGRSKNRDEFLKYHASHLPTKSAQSVCMHREDASTVSFSQVDVSNQKTSFTYADGSPCLSELVNELTIQLV